MFASRVIKLVYLTWIIYGPGGLLQKLA